MFKTPIFIPSRSRASRLEKSVLKKLPREILEKTNMVVPPDQHNDYCEALDKMGNIHTNVISLNVEGIAATRQGIGHIARSLRLPAFAMLDDDLTDWATRISLDSHKLRQSTPEDMVEMFEWIQKTLETYAHCSVSPRGNNMIRHGQNVWVGEKPLTQENVRTLRLLAYQTDAFLSVEHGRVSIMEDFDVNLQLLEKGHKNIQSYWWTQDQRQSALPGGCSDYRTLEVHEQGAKTLAELHPQFVKLRSKQNKAIVTYNKEFSTRTEVTIAWKKAYASSHEMEKPLKGNRDTPQEVEGEENTASVS